MVDLEADVLDGVLAPQLILTLREEHEGQRYFIHYHVDVFLDHPAGHLELNADLDTF